MIQFIFIFYQGGSCFHWFSSPTCLRGHLLITSGFKEKKISSGLKVFLLWWPPLIEVECKKCLTSWLTYRQFSWVALLLSIIGLTSSPSVFPWLRYFAQSHCHNIFTKIFCTNFNWLVLFQTTVTASAHLTVSITLERYFAVVHPLSHFHRR